MTSHERTEWLKLRRTGIGGSDVAAILGLSQWRSALDVYNDKTSTEEPKDEPSEAAHFGTILEDIVAKEFARRTGMKVQRVNRTLRGDDDDNWMIANIDRAIVNENIAGRVFAYKIGILDGRRISTNIILECKTANQFTAHLWGDSQEDEIVSGKVVTEHKIPIYYETQCQWYMGITGADVCYLAVLIGGQDFRIYKIDRDDVIIKALQEKCRAFWFGNVVTGIPPEPTTKEEVAQIFGVDNGEMIEATNEVAADIGELINLQAKIKQLQDAQDVVKDRICAAIGEHQGITIAGEKACTFKTQTTRRLDTTALKKAEPELCQRFTKETTTRVFRLAA